MFRLAKPAVPIIALTLLAAMLSAFVQPVWWIPLLAVPGYWIVALLPCKGSAVPCDVDYEDLCGLFGMIEVPVYEGFPARCNGITPRTMHIIFPFCKIEFRLIKPVLAHELSHLYYNHPFTNVFYFTLCCIGSACCLYYNLVVATIFAVGIIPFTIWKTMQMEITADRLADSFSDMRALLKTHPDDSIRKMRLAALDGKRS